MADLDGNLSPYTLDQSCLTKLFRIPVCSSNSLHDVNNTEGYGTFKTYVSYTMLDHLLTSTARMASIQAGGLSLACLSLAYLINLTPAHKRRTPLFRIFLVGLISAIFKLGIGIYIYTNSLRVSSYGNMTNDWAGLRLSVSYKTCLTVMHTSSVVSLVCFQIALFIQGRSLLTWLKLRNTTWIYNTVLGVMVLLSVIASIYYMAFQSYQLFWYGFPPDGTQPKAIPVQWWYSMLRFASSTLVTLGAMLWSIVFAINSLRLVWQRRKLLFSTIEAESEDAMAGTRVVRGQNTPVRPRKNEIGNSLEKMLTIVGLIGLQSMIPVVVLIIVYYVSARKFEYDSLMIPIFLALLPLHSLLANVTDQEDRLIDVQREVDRRLGFHPELAHALSEAGRVRNQRSHGRPEVVSEHDKSGGQPGLGPSQTVPRYKTSVSEIDRELREIDRMT